MGVESGIFSIHGEIENPDLHKEKQYRMFLIICRHCRYQLNQRKKLKFSEIWKEIKIQ